MTVDLTPVASSPVNIAEFDLYLFGKGRHFDLYRVTSADEAYEIGLDDALEDGAAVI